MNQKTHKPCKVCNTEFKMYKSTDKYCSIECANKDKKQNIKLKPIDYKKKKCKGTGDAKDFGCGELVTNRKYGLGIKCGCYADFLLNSSKGKDLIKKAEIKVTSPRVQLEEAELENKERVKLNYLLTNVKNICHEYIRLRDKGKDCISCGSLYNSSQQAGHFYKAELFSNLRFDENNISGQCMACNLRKEGNESGYRAGLIQRYGIEFVQSLDEKAKDYKRNDFKWDRESLVEIRSYYKEKLKQLKLNNNDN